VNAPRTWPNSSLSSSGAGTAAQLTATKGCSRRGDRWWSARATSSLPVPDSPVMSTVASLSATRLIIATVSLMASLSPAIPSIAIAAFAVRSRFSSRWSSRCSIARPTAISSASTFTGLVM
jgi:hypothetical protein